MLADWGLGGTVVGRAQKKAQAYPASTTLHTESSCLPRPDLCWKVMCTLSVFLEAGVLG